MVGSKWVGVATSLIFIITKIWDNLRMFGYKMYLFWEWRADKKEIKTSILIPFRFVLR